MLSVEDLVVTFGERAVLSGISLEVNPGEVVGLIGPNGCGKTTFLNAVSGFLRPMAGSIVFDDEDVTHFSAYKRAKMGIGRGFQSVGVFREMTLEENLMITLEHAQGYPWWWRFSKSHRDKADRIIEEALESMQLLGHKHSLAGVLSGGQLRLLELLRLKISGGSLLLIDEPTAGVAPVMKKQLAASIRDLAQDQSRSILIVEHDLKFLFGLVDRVIVLVEGEVYLSGKPKDVANDAKLKEVYFGVH